MPIIAGILVGSLVTPHVISPKEASPPYVEKLYPAAVDVKQAGNDAAVAQLAADYAAERAEVARERKIAKEARVLARQQAADAKRKRVEQAAQVAQAAEAKRKAQAQAVAVAEVTPPKQAPPTVKAAQVKRKSTPAPRSAPTGVTYEATAYTAFCSTGCIGITATGLDVSNTIYAPSGRRIVAVDPSVIPLGSVVTITFASGKSIVAEASDTGGAIRGNRIDLLVANKAEARSFGRQAVKIQRK